MILQCRHCGAALTVEDSQRTTVCVFCDSPSVVERPESEAGPRPAFTIGFVQPEEDVRRLVAKWLQTRSIFCPGDIRHANVEDLKGVYLPAYLYSAVSRTNYTADIGENYQELETYTTTDSKGQTVTKTRVVTRTEWRSLRGTRVANITNVLVTASKGLSNEELFGIRPYDWRALKRFNAAMVAGWPAENASLDEEECFRVARAEADIRASNALPGFMPGDSHRALRSQTVLEQEAADLVLVPAWLLNARYSPEKPPIRIVVNGQTGAVHGKPPLSAWRIAFAILLAIVVALGLYFYAQSGAL